MYLLICRKTVLHHQKEAELQWSIILMPIIFYTGLMLVQPVPLSLNLHAPHLTTGQLAHTFKINLKIPFTGIPAFYICSLKLDIHSVNGTPLLLISFENKVSIYKVSIFNNPAFPIYIAKCQKVAQFSWLSRRYHSPAIPQTFVDVSCWLRSNSKHSLTAL